MSSYLGFFVVQVHSYGIPIELSNSTNPTSFNAVNGTNVGLVQVNHLNPDPFEFFVTADPTKRIYVLIVVVAYSSKGKCELS